ncbi:MAG: hypothetical protein CL850_03720 [Crocinitomicaceae bacterium]|nr:hypothetical protein [Crocinitomicaceae bacterium]
MKQKKINSKFLILEKKNKLKFVNTILPKPKKNQLLVKILYTSICASQIMEYKGLRGYDKWLPHAFGHEAVGIIVSIGKNIKKFKVKQKIILSWIRKKGSEVSGKIMYGKKNHFNYGPITTFSSYTLVSQNSAFPIPKNIKIKSASLFGCAIPTGMGMVLNEAKPKKKNRCAIIGFGGVGVFVLFALKFLKITNITVIDTNDNKLRIAKYYGIKNLINPKKNKKIYGNFDFIFESTGQSKSIENSIKLLKNSGKIFFASHPAKNQKINLDPHELIKGKKIYGSWGGKSNLRRDIPRFNKILSNMKINIDKFCSYHSFDKIIDLIKNFNNSNNTRSIIKM